MLAENFAEHGEQTIEQVRTAMPHIYLRIIASLLPRSLHVERTSHFADLSDDELTELERHLAASRAQTVRTLEQYNGDAVTQPVPSSEDEPEKPA